MPKYTKRSTGGKSAGFKKKGKYSRKLKKYEIKKWQRLANANMEKKTLQENLVMELYKRPNTTSYYGWSFPFVNKYGNNIPYELRHIVTRISAGSGNSNRTGS